MTTGGDVRGRLYDPTVVEHELTTLTGGERVISEHVPGVRSVALGFWIGAGSRDEPETRAGVSHFIEHLLFKGSSRYSAQEIAEIFDTLGGELNAATSRETTVVYARVPDERLETALDVITDMVFEPAFAEVDSEREVVLEEIAMVEDTPQDLVHDIVAEAVFGGHPLGRPVIGRADVDRIATPSIREEQLLHRSCGRGDHRRSLGRHDIDRVMYPVARPGSGERVDQVLALYAFDRDRQPGRADDQPFRHRHGRLSGRRDIGHLPSGFELAGSVEDSEREDPEGARQYDGNDRRRDNGQDSPGFRRIRAIGWRS